MSWQLLTGISVILYSVSILFERKLLTAEQSRPIAFAIIFQLLIGSISGLIGLFSIFRIDWSVNIAPHFVLMILLYGIGNIFFFKSLKETEASKFTILFATHGFWTILGSSILLGEGLLPKQLVGAVLIFLSVVIVHAKQTKLSLVKGEVFALFSAILFGLANTNDRFLLHYFDTYSYTTISFVLPGLFLAILHPKDFAYAKQFLKKDFLPKLLLLTFLFSLSALAFFSALKIAPNSSQVASAFVTNVLLTVLLAVVFLRERKYLLQKALAAVVCFAGLMLIT
ncbi:EamA family transporter [Candidatus Microgenomates bacterium]|nr:MAG: EamA family transporter [Candidatus Microgenomates bacterium]